MVDFAKSPSEKYNLTVLPGALTDFYDNQNDTLRVQFTTRTTAEFGNLRLHLKNVKRFPVIIQLTDAKGSAIATEVSDGKSIIDFNLLEPAKYTVRLIYDDNKNGEYDPGNFLEKRYSEEVIYFNDELDVRANWDVDQVFDVSIPYVPKPTAVKGKVDGKKGGGYSGGPPQ